MSGGGPSAGWYGDPGGGHEFRYWDGASWTDNVADAGVASTDAARPTAFPLPTQEPSSSPAQASGTSSTSFDSPQVAPAQAAAAYAYPKARRPWYRKMRWWFVGAFALIIVVAVWINHTGKTSSAKSATQQTSAGIRTPSGNAPHALQADINAASTTCTTVPTLGVARASGTLTNHSSKASNYLITVTFKNASGVQFANGTAVVQNVGPRVTAIWSADSTMRAPAGHWTCAVVQARRSASSG